MRPMGAAGSVLLVSVSLHTLAQGRLGNLVDSFAMRLLPVFMLSLAGGPADRGCKR